MLFLLFSGCFQLYTREWRSKTTVKSVYYLGQGWRNYLTSAQRVSAYISCYITHRFRRRWNTSRRNNFFEPLPSPDVFTSSECYRGAQQSCQARISIQALAIEQSARPNRWRIFAPWKSIFKIGLKTLKRGSRATGKPEFSPTPACPCLKINIKILNKF